MKKQIRVYTGGVYDVLHRGHIRLLSRAKELGDYLVVGIQADEAVQSVPGKSKPILTTEERVEQMRSLPYADEIIVYHSAQSPETIAKVRPDIFVHADDWQRQCDRSEVIKYMNEHNIKLVLLPRTEGISDTEIKERIIERFLQTNQEK